MLMCFRRATRSSVPSVTSGWFPYVNVPTTSTSSEFTEKQGDFPTLSISEGYGGHSISVNEQDILQTPSKEGLFISPPPPSLHLTSSSIAGDLFSESRTKPGVKITIQYPSKPRTKFLPSEYEALGKALVYGPPQRIAKAVVRCKIVDHKCFRVFFGWFQAKSVVFFPGQTHPFWANVARKIWLSSIFNRLAKSGRTELRSWWPVAVFDCHKIRSGFQVWP